ncbi:MAG TPA: outer membrane protein assembly factor BamD [Pyrinomonadaceae bacterium]|jgi:outer membrane protein assembly factor BamD (BamD/ComL family)|nr:outer membrane protein assembly factor BamD [Pyrinomonadaceae bacterium]
MKRHFVTLSLAILSVFVLSGLASAQKQIDPKVLRDPLLEADARHNLEVANNYFKLKKAYIGSLKRCEEIMAAYPDFSHMDEVLYVAGMSSYYLADGKGKQKAPQRTEDDKRKYDPVKLREDALAYLSQLVEKYPQSPFLPDAERLIKELEAKK